MSIFHFKAELLDTSEDGTHIYRYFPDYIEAPTVSGTFSTKISDWEPNLLTASGGEEKRLVSTDKSAILKLTISIIARYEAEGKMPTEVYRVS